MKLNVFDWRHESHETDIPVEDVNSLYVVVFSGNELVTVMMNDGTEKKIDAIELANGDSFFDGEYAVHKDDLEEWLGRVDSYDWFGRMLKDAEV